MSIVKMDGKGRIQLPSYVRRAWHLRPSQALVVELAEDRIYIRRQGRLDPQNDPLLRDILMNPLRSKKRITKALLRKLGEEQWSA